MGELSDEQLVELVWEKDQERYAELVRRYQGKLQRYVFYLTGGHVVAEEIAQETFIKAFVNLQSFDVKRKFSSWLYRIAHNEAVNY